MPNGNQEKIKYTPGEYAKKYSTPSRGYYSEQIKKTGRLPIPKSNLIAIIIACIVIAALVAVLVSYYYGGEEEVVSVEQVTAIQPLEEAPVETVAETEVELEEETILDITSLAFVKEVFVGEEVEDYEVIDKTEFDVFEEFIVYADVWNFAQQEVEAGYYVNIVFGLNVYDSNGDLVEHLSNPELETIEQTFVEKQDGFYFVNFLDVVFLNETYATLLEPDDYLIEAVVKDLISGEEAVHDLDMTILEFELE